MVQVAQAPPGVPRQAREVREARVRGPHRTARVGLRLRVVPTAPAVRRRAMAIPRLKVLAVLPRRVVPTAPEAHHQGTAVPARPPTLQRPHRPQALPV